MQNVTKEFSIWKQFKLALQLCKIQCYKVAQKVLESVINENNFNQAINWEIIYSLLYGVLLDCNLDQVKKAEGQRFLKEAIKLLMI